MATDTGGAGLMKSQEVVSSANDYQILGKGNAGTTVASTSQKRIKKPTQLNQVTTSSDGSVGNNRGVPGAVK